METYKACCKAAREEETQGEDKDLPRIYWEDAQQRYF